MFSTQSYMNLWSRFFFASHIDKFQLTPLTMRVPTLVTKPLTFSDLSDDRARVEPGSSGANKARHSCRPLFKDAKFSCNRLRSHSSSAAYHIINRCSSASKIRPAIPTTPLLP